MAVAKSLRAILLGSPVDPQHQVVAAELLAALAEIELRTALNLSPHFVDTLAELSDVPIPVTGVAGFVLDDGEDSGVYRRGSSEWMKTSELPAAFSDAVSALAQFDLLEANVNTELVAVKAAVIAAASDPEVAAEMVAEIETLTGAAVAATGADRVQTGLDVVAADAGAARAEAALDAVTLATLVAGAARDTTIAAAITSARGAVSDGATFAATGDDVDYIGVYLRTSSSAETEISRQPTAAATDAIRQGPSLQFAQPNLVSARADRVQSTLDFGGLGTSTLTPVIVNGLPAWRLTVVGANAAPYRVPRAAISGNVASASVSVLALSAAGVGATSTNTRVMLRQLRANASEITAARQSVTLTDPTAAALSAPRRAAFANVALDAECATVELWIEAQNTGGATARTLDFRELHISAGPSAVYRAPPDAFIVDANAEIRARADWAWTQNDWPDSDLLQVGSAVTWGAFTQEVVSIHGRLALQSPASASAVSVPAPSVDVSGYASGKVSVSVVIEDKPAIADGALRFRLVARDAGGVILPWTDQRDTDFVTEPNAYTRFVPAVAIASPTTLVIAREIGLPVGTSTLTLDMRVETTEQMLFNKICFREGGDPSYKATPVVAAAELVPNSVSQPVADYLPGAFATQDATRRVSVISADGQKKHRITFDAASAALAFMPMPRGNILDLESGFVSFFARVSASAGNGSTGNTRVLLLFRNGDTELSAFRQTLQFNSNGGAVTDQVVSFAGVAVPTDPWDNVRVIWDAQPGNGTIARTMDVHDVMLTGRLSSVYRPRGARSLGSVPVVSGFTVLPDLPGGPPAGGFTCTGLDKINTGPFAGCMLIASDGRTVEGDGSPHAARAVITTPDFARLLASYDLSNMTSDGVQGIAWDSSDGTFWVARPGLKRIEHYNSVGAEISADRIALTGWAGAWDTPNGLAYDPVNDALYVCSASSATVYRIPKAATISATHTIGSATPDHLCLFDGKLSISVGANGVKGEMHEHDLTTGVNSILLVQIPFAEAIEGIWRDAFSFAFVNDGGFHTVASPALNFGAMGRFSAAA